MARGSPLHHLLKGHKEVKSQVLMKFILDSFSFEDKNFNFRELVYYTFQRVLKREEKKCSPPLLLEEVHTF